MSENNTNEKMIKQQHKDYTENISLWNLQLEAYLGSGGFANGDHIIQHPNETNEKLSRRRKNAYYHNFCRAIVDTYVNHLYKTSVQRSDIPKVVEAFYKQTNQSGDIVGDKDIDELMKEAATLAQVFGHCFIVVDRVDAEFSNRQHEIDEGTPYAYILTPLDVIDWQIGDDESLLWVKVKETHVTNKDDPLGKHESTAAYRIWTREDWVLYNSEGGIVDGREHNLGSVPFVIVYNKKKPGKTIIGVSEINDIAPMNKALYNRTSELGELIRAQAFNILIYPSLDIKDNDLCVSTERVLVYDPSDGGKPEYIAPSGSAMNAYEIRIGNIIENIWQLARLSYKGGVKTSGVEMAWEFEKTNQALQDKSRALQEAEQRVMQLVCKWTDEKDCKGIIEYPKEFNLRDLLKEVTAAMEVFRLNLSDMFNKEYRKVMARKLLSSATGETMKAIESEIDADADSTNIIVRQNSKPVSEKTEGDSLG